MSLFVWGGCAMASAVIALFFWRFFRDTGDRLFAMFSLAFWALASHWAALASLTPGEETRHYFYVLRLIAFLLILTAVIDKNRKHSPD
jgi:peptidoglycan/LPS O-acetylase OafA/YrhL